MKITNYKLVLGYTLTKVITKNFGVYFSEKLLDYTITDPLGYTHKGDIGTTLDRNVIITDENYGLIYLF